MPLLPTIFTINDHGDGVSPPPGMKMQGTACHAPTTAHCPLPTAHYFHENHLHPLTFKLSPSDSAII